MTMTKTAHWLFLSPLLLLALTQGCGRGSDEITHIGVCDAYPAPAASPYKLPWAPGIARTVGQGNCSAASHFADYRYAYDIGMDVGAAIHAARAGTVIGVKEDETDGNGCPRANYVYVEHSDGTVGQYAHLTRNGAVVNVNDVVTQGQHIANAGNTGCSTGAHLHFQVVRTRYSSETLPVTFSNAANESRGLRSGTSYTAN